MKKLLLTIGLLLALFIVLPASASAANRYWVGGGATANWNATGNTNWGTASNTQDNASVPGTADVVIFDGVGTGASNATLNVDTSIIGSINFTGYTNTFTQNAGADLSVGGNITFSAGMTYTPTDTSFLDITNIATLTTAGQLMPNIQKRSGNNALTLGDNLTFIASKIIVLTITPNSQINLNGKTVSGNSATNRVLVKNGAFGGDGGAYIIVNGGTFANADFRDTRFDNGGSSLDLSAITGLSGDAGGNVMHTGGTLTLTTSQTQYWIGDTGSWSTAAEWGTTSGGSGGRVPLPQDDVVFDNNSFSTTGFTVTQDMPRMGRDISWSAVTDSSAPTLSNSTVPQTLYGSLTFISGMTHSGGGNATWTFETRSASTITSAGKSFSQNVSFYMFGGSVAIQDAFNGNIQLYNGTITNPNNSSVTGSTIQIYGTATRSLTLGSATWTVSGTGNMWYVQSQTGLTFSSTGSTISMTDVSTTAKTFTGAGLTYNNLSITSDGTAGNTTFTGSNTFTGNWTIGAGGIKSIILTDGTTQTFTTAQTSLGNGTNVITFTKSGAGTDPIISSASGIFSWDYVSLTNIDASTGAAFYAGPLSHSTDGGGNANWIFTVAPLSVNNVIEFNDNGQTQFYDDGMIIFY